MGLAAPKNRSRIANDPQNTTWANDTSRFGARILSSQGWTPGSSLGKKDAAHAEHYTAASHSHIRVLLKEDTLGLGAKRGSERAENFGLAALESVLGRLNGREEEVKKEEERRLDIERRGFVARKYGTMNFVSGGFLVGDKIEKKIKKDVEVKLEVKEEDVDLDMGAINEKKTKKRKRSGDEVEVKKEVSDEQPKLKRKKKSMNLRAAVEEEMEAEASEDAIPSKSKSKKDKKKSKKTSTSEPATNASTPESLSPASEEPLSDKAKRKAERRARKEEKKLRKALKKAAKEAARSEPTAADSSSESEEEETPVTTSGPTTGTSTPLSAACGLTFGAGGRHAVRQRYIRQKKMASMDPQALKEIFMIKTPS